MSTLIVYATKYGATKQIVDEMAQKLGQDVTIKNIKDGRIDIKNYDTIIIGGSIYMNKIQKKIKRFVKRKESQLLQKRLGLFIGCYTPADTKGYLEQFFPSPLLEHAKAKGILGGMMQYDKMNAIYRKIFLSLKKIDDFNKNFKEPVIEEEQINQFVTALQ